MSKLTPIQCELVENHVPPVAKGWYMSTQEENNFLLKKLKELDVMGIVRETKNPVYGSTAFTVPKKGPKKYRMVLNMKPLNNITKNSALVLPNSEKQFTFLRSAKIFASFDMLSGF